MDADAREQVKPCTKCGSLDGRVDPRNGRIKRTRGLCSRCHDAWWSEYRATEKRLAALLAARPAALVPDPVKAWSETETEGTDWAALTGPRFTRTLRRLWRRRPKSTLRFFAGQTAMGD